MKSIVFESNDLYFTIIDTQFFPIEETKNKYAFVESDEYGTPLLPHKYIDPLTITVSEIFNDSCTIAMPISLTRKIAVEFAKKALDRAERLGNSFDLTGFFALMKTDYFDLFVTDYLENRLFRLDSDNNILVS